VRRGLVILGLTLAALPCAYADFVDAWQLATFAGFAVRLDEDLPLEAWRDIGFTALQTIVIASALLVALQGLQGRGYRKSAIALAIAWLGSAPLYVSILMNLRL
jgi:hypothetical protein